MTCRMSSDNKISAEKLQFLTWGNGITWTMDLSSSKTNYEPIFSLKNAFFLFAIVRQRSFMLSFDSDEH